MKKIDILSALFSISFILAVFFNPLYSQNIYEGILLDTVKAGEFDNGKMWTFNHPPLDYFKSVYNFHPDKNWLDNVRMAALKFATYCSASFISEDGLVLTNHHCGRDAVISVTKTDENLSVNGFYAAALEDERKVPNLFVDQLIEIIDVTDIVQKEIDKGGNDVEKMELKDTKGDELVKQFEEQLNLKCEFVTLYNGGEYCIYAYKRYDDVRLVFAPENQIGFFGGDYDNFTYPRYNLDITFFRVYDNNQPLKTEHFYKWSITGIDSGDVVFVVGNPGSTQRLKTVAELELLRDQTYPSYLSMLNFYLKMTEAMNPQTEQERIEQENQYFEIQNSLKAISGFLKALNNPYFMAKKKAFERDLTNKVNSDTKLKQKYGNLWNDIKDIIKNKSEDENYQKKLDAKNRLLGKLVFEIYGPKIPPDATFTLRIADGVVSSYDFNGTVAPVFTTFYGLYDKYYGFKKKYPFSLPEKWQNPPADLLLETPFNFISTNDIVGGNSGSPVINKNAEIIGLAFDGNIESLSSDFIYSTENNRMVGVDCRGILASLKYIYNAERLFKEMEKGKIDGNN